MFSRRLCASSASAQNPDTLTPDASTAKAKQILQQLIDAFGGPTYLDIRDSDCEGRLARFGHNGEMSGYTNFKDYWRYPDANRTDYSKKGVVINLYVGDKGWTLDKGGVSELSAAAVADFQDQAKRDINNLLRVRIKEPGMTLRYGGTDIVDLKTVDWVDITDSDQRNFRLAVDRSSHLLARSVISTPDETMNDRNVETNIYTNFQLHGRRPHGHANHHRPQRPPLQSGFLYHLQVQLRPAHRPVHQGCPRQTFLRGRQ